MTRSALSGAGVRRRTAAAALVVAALAALGLRLAGLQWDDGTQLHPDERFLTMVTTALGRGKLEAPGPGGAERLAACKARHPGTAGVGPWLDTACSDWAPANVGFAFYPYGILPVAAVRAAAGLLVHAGLSRAADYAEIPTVGRIAATLADLVALAGAYLLGRALGGRRAGLAAAAFYALAVLPLQLARFYTVDPFATALAALAMVFAVRVARRGNASDVVALGFAAGLAAACKLSLAPLLALVAPAALLAPRRDGSPPPPPAQNAARALAACAVAGVAAFAIFRIAQPIVFSGPRLLDVQPAPGAIALYRELAGQLGGTADMPPSWQWIGRTRWIDPLRNLLLFGLGPALAIAAVAGVALALARALQGPAFRRRGSIVLLVAVIAYGGWLGAQFVSSMRYWLPLYPALAAFAGWALVAGSAWLRRRLRVARVLPAVAIAASAVTAAAWLSVPLSAPTRLWASHWMLERVPAGVSAPLAGERGPLPRRVNWAVDGEVPGTPRELPTRTWVATSGTIDRLELRLPASAPDSPEAATVVASVVRDDGTVLLRPTPLTAKAAPQAPAGFDARDRVLVARLPAPVALTAGWKVDLRLSASDGPLALEGSAIATEGPWDDPVPMRGRRLPPDTLVEPGVPGFVRAGRAAEGVDPFGQRYFRGLDLGIVNRDDEGKRAALASALDRAAWVTISSQRFYDSVSRDPYRFPLTTHYYEALFAGRLGFDVVATFRSPPRLGPVAFDPQVYPWPDGYLATRARADANPEEALSVYDHPPVFVLRKRADYDAARVREILAEPVLRTFDEARRDGPPASTGRVDRSPAGASTAPDLLMLAPERIAALDAAGPPAPSPLGPWSAAIAWYLVVALLGASALPLLLALVPAQPALAFALARTAGVFAFGGIAWWSTWAGVDLWQPAALGGLAAALVAGGALAASRTRATLAAAWSREGRRAEAVFALAFAAAIALRLANPDLWAPGYGGEKPMDFAWLNAVMRTDTFPPYDPWFAGGQLNYYYGGFVPVAALAKLTGTPPAIAFNLAVALWMALTGAAVFGLARALALAMPGTRDGRATLAGAIAAVAAVGAGNLGIVSALVAAPPAGDGVLARLASLVASADPRWYWSPTRIVAERTMSGNEIHEFPFFTFLHADLHAHLLALPLMVAAWGMASWIALGADRIRARWLAAVALAAAIAALARAANSWDWPLATALGAGAILVGAWRRRDDAGAWRPAIAALALFTSVQLVVAWPFSSSFATGGVGLHRYTGPATPFVAWLQHYGLFVWVLLPWLLFPDPGAADGGAARSRAATRVRVALLAVAIAGFAAVAVALALAAGLGGGAPAAGAIVAMLALALREALDASAPAARRWIATIAAVAFAVQLVPEFLVVGHDIGRQNTYFKFHLQSWIALALAAGPAAAALLAPPASRVWRTGFAALALVAIAYVPLGAAGRAGARFPGERPATLDGLAFLASAKLDRGGRTYALAEDRAIADWLASRAPRGAVVLEAQLPEYQYGSRIASFTGLPTLLGYRWHETQQRPLAPLGEVVNLRVASVDAIYRSTDESKARRALDDYRVRYVVVGGLERAVYPAEGLAKFDAWAASGRARIAFRAGESTIYELAPRPADGWPLL